MKILLVTDSYSLGGAEHHGLKLARYLQSKGIETEFWVFREGDGRGREICKEWGIPTRIITDFIYFRDGFEGLRQIFHYVRMVWKFNPSCIISFNFRSNVWNGIISRFARIKCSVWSQQNIPEEYWVFPRSVSAAKNVTCFISNADHLNDLLRASVKPTRPAEDFHVVWNGIPEAPAQPTETDWGKILEKDRFNRIVTMPANLTELKDHATVLRAWAIVLKKVPEHIKPLLAFAGRKDTTTESIIALIDELGIAENVKVLGFVKDVYGLNLHSHVGVLSSLTEGLPTSVLEQMQAGLPMVGTNNPGISEAVGPKMVKYLSDYQDHEGLAKNILFFLENPEVASREGQENKRRVAELFTVDQVGENTLKIISSYLS